MHKNFINVTCQKKKKKLKQLEKFIVIEKIFI